MIKDRFIPPDEGVQTPGSPHNEISANHDDFSFEPDYIEQNGIWELGIQYLAKGTKSEVVYGMLFCNGKIVNPKQENEEIDTALGRMKYYGNIKPLKYIAGWNYANDELIQNSWNIITLRGRMVFETIEGPHYELEADNGKRYILLGNLTAIEKINGANTTISSRVEITGFELKNTPTIYMSGIPFHVIRLKILR